MRRTAPPSGRAWCGAGADWSAISLLNPQFSSRFNPTLRGNLAEAKTLILAKQRGFESPESRAHPARLGVLHVKVCPAVTKGDLITYPNIA